MEHNFTKSVVFGGKAVSVGAEVTAEMLSKINRFALKELTADDVYVRKFLQAHNGVDRDRERFSEELLDDFAATLPGKSFLFAHDRRSSLPFGLYFDASTEEMTVEQFKSLTGEDPRLPDDVEMVKVLWSWVYLMKETDYNQDFIINLDGGTYRHVSIGFSASDLDPVKGAFEQVLFWEYKAPGEATEGSLVWLGAQQGATGQKAFKAEKTQTGGLEKMKSLIAGIGDLLGKTFGKDDSEESVVAAVKTTLAAKEKKITDLTDELDGLKDLAEDGKAYRTALVDDYARMKAALGECKETDDALKQVKGFAQSMALDFLKSEVKSLQVRMEKKFPDGPQLSGDDKRDKSDDGKSTADKNASGKNNPLIPQEEK